MIINKIAKMIYNMNKGSIDSRIDFLAKQYIEKATEEIECAVYRAVEEKAAHIFKEPARAGWGFQPSGGLGSLVELHIARTIEKMIKEEKMKVGEDIVLYAQDQHFLEAMLTKEMAKHGDKIIKAALEQHVQNVVKDVVDKSFKI